MKSTTIFVNIGGMLNNLTAEFTGTFFSIFIDGAKKVSDASFLFLTSLIGREVRLSGDVYSATGHLLGRAGDFVGYFNIRFHQAGWVSEWAFVAEVLQNIDRLPDPRQALVGAFWELLLSTHKATPENFVLIVRRTPTYYLTKNGAEFLQLASARIEEISPSISLENFQEKYKEFSDYLLELKSGKRQQRAA